jgi:hypothetical protein
MVCGLSAGGKWIRTIGSRKPATPSTRPPICAQSARREKTEKRGLQIPLGGCAIGDRPPVFLQFEEGPLLALPRGRDLLATASCHRWRLPSLSMNFGLLMSRPSWA